MNHDAAPIVLTAGKTAVTVNLNGGRIESLIINGTELWYSGPRGDGKTAATHPCSPIFGPETTTSYSLSQHGPARNTRHDIVSQNDTQLVMKCRIHEGSYPDGVEYHQTITVDTTSVIIETTHRNTGNNPAPVNFGEHCYWVTPSGWNGLTINDRDVTDGVNHNGSIDMAARSIIQLPGQPPIRLDQSGFSKAVLWSYHNVTAGSYDQQYVCIEPAELDPMGNSFGTPVSLISPGASRSTSLKISLA